jgi:hypothetical protein
VDHLDPDKQVPAGAYTDDPDGIARAIIDCHDWLARWPTQWEFRDWVQMRRAAARAGGKPLPVVPDREKPFSAFAEWADAVTFAARNESRLRSTLARTDRPRTPTTGELRDDDAEDAVADADARVGYLGPEALDELVVVEDVLRQPRRPARARTC